MKFLKKTLNKPTKTCDRCNKQIKETERAIGFHGEDHESFLCEACITVIYNEYIEELDD